jgi:hypothetical protein
VRPYDEESGSTEGSESLLPSMPISSQRISNRLRLSAVFLSLALGGTFLFVALGTYESVSIWEGRFYDQLWLPLWGYVFYWGAPWSQIGCFAFGLLLLLLWASWVLQMGLLELPGFLCAWVYLDFVQSSGLILVRLRHNIASFVARLNLQAKQTRLENRSVILKVAELLERRDHERLRSSQASENDAANELHRKLETRLQFLAEYQYAESSSIDGLIAAARWYQFAKTEQSWQHLQSCLHQKEDASALSSVIHLLTRHSHTQDTTFLKAAEALIRPDLEKVWELLQKLAAIQQSRPTEFLWHDIQQFSSSSQIKLSHRFGDVLELWIVVAGDLIQQGELERVADAALELSRGPLQRHLEILRNAPGSFDLSTVETFLMESELRRPESIRHVCGVTYASLSERSLSPLADYWQSQALRHFYSRYDSKWIKAASSQL